MHDFEGELEDEIPRHINNWDKIPQDAKDSMIYWLKEYDKL